MTFPATNGASVPLTLDAAWAQARDTAAQIQVQANSLNAQIAAGNVNAQVLINAQTLFVALNTRLTTIASMSGIVAYAQAQVSNPSLDVAAAFTAMQNALIACGTWIINNFPKDTGNFLQAVSFSGGNVVWATFSTAQLSGLATLLTALLATIG